MCVEKWTLLSLDESETEIKIKIIIIEYWNLSFWDDSNSFISSSLSLARSLFLSIPFSTNFRSCSGRVFYLSLSSVCFLFFQFIQLKFSTRARSFILLLKIVFSFSLFQNREEWLEYTLFFKILFISLIYNCEQTLYDWFFVK